jgi:hypothetical protein
MYPLNYLYSINDNSCSSYYKIIITPEGKSFESGARYKMLRDALKILLDDNIVNRNIFNEDEWYIYKTKKNKKLIQALFKALFSDEKQEDLI